MDSTGKPDARLADLRFNMVGSFDQCVKVNVNIQKSDPNSATNTTGDVSYDHAVKGTYFVTYIVMPPDIVPASSQYLVSSFLDICIHKQNICVFISLFLIAWL